MSRSKLIRADDGLITIITYASKRLQKNANLNIPISFPKVTRIMASQSIIDGDLIMFKLPKEKYVIKKLLRKPINME